MEEKRDIYKETYIHPDSDEIRSFVLQIKKDTTTIREFFEKLFKWFDENIEYSRLNNPFTPLQRSDLDLLHMKSGTCGDYANLIVSILISLGIPAKYAYLKRDCYGDEQDHICAAAFIDDKWILIDATLPYRKWYGFDCPHQEYDLLEPLEFEKKMKVIEQKCISQAIGMGNLQYAGILYAPWIHDDIVLWNKDRYDSVFYLFILNDEKSWTLYINYMVYTKDGESTTIMVTATEDTELYQFSIHPAESVWDDAQWSDCYTIENIPTELRTEELDKMRENMKNNIPKIIDSVGV